MTEKNDKVSQDKVVKKNLHNGVSTSKRVPFPAALIANVVDQIIIAVISIVVVFVLNFIMQFAGYYVAQKLQMFLIIYIICNILYTALFESSKSFATPGKKLFKAQVTSK